MGTGSNKVIPLGASGTRPGNNGSIPLAHQISILGVWIANVGPWRAGKHQGFSADALLFGHAVREDGSGHFPDGRLLVDPSSCRRRAAVSLALGGSGRTFRSTSANSKTAIPNQTFGASMTGDARAFANEVLVAGFVVGVDDCRDAVEGPFQRVPAQALMTFSDDAVDAPVRTVGDTVDDLG